MRPADALRALNRAQGTLWFKIVASAVVVALAAAALITYIVTVQPPEYSLESEAGLTSPDAKDQLSPEVRSDLERTQRLINDVLAQRKSTGSVAAALAALAGICLLVVWLGLALTYLALALGAVAAWALAVAVAWLASLAGMPYPEQALAPGGGLARLLAGVAILAASFTAVMSGLRLLFSALPGPIPAVARNVLAEAVRMKISLVFIVLLILGMAALPGLLDPTTPLRYRVQAFLQYGTGGSFWIIAILTLLFAAATLSFEQRDRVIWQTMTKPVASWQYLLGKWLGVVSLAAVLLAVCASGIFLFTEYLRSRPAHGEISPYVAADGSPMTEDRRILQFQVLQASVSAEPLPSFQPDDTGFLEAVEQYIQEQRRIAPDFDDSPAQRAKIREDLYKQLQQVYRAIDPGSNQTFRFTGLQRARKGDVPLVLRYRVDSGSNMPDQIYRLTWIIGGQPYIRPCGLGQMHVIDSLPPALIDADGNLDVTVVNGDAYTRVANPMTISFPPGGLEVAYSVGSYRMNFLRVVLVLWVKLAFLAMLAVWASTFLSFPVACMVAFGAFFAAEGSGFLGEAAEYYASGANTGLSKAFDVVIREIAMFVSRVFSTYGDLRPNTRLVEGRLVSWGSVAAAVAVLGVWIGALYGLAVQIFRRRELAMYSGQ